MPPTYPNDPVDRGLGHDPSKGGSDTESASDVASGSSLVGPDATRAHGPSSETMPLTRAGSVEETAIAGLAAPGTEPMVAEPQTGPGTVSVPGYRVLREIARGGMGRVLAARDLSLDRDVALKTLLPGASADRFVRESKITARLPHPGIPPVHAMGTLPDGSPFLAMKLIAGQTLADELKTADRPRLLQVFTQVCQAVGFAHSRGVIHRDLKPANVMVGAFGEV
jgi:eukaryotic-like serine/threonine-protein kinase